MFSGKLSSCLNGETRPTNVKDGTTRILDTLTSTPQRIVLQGNSECHTFGIYSNDVVITASPSSQHPSSSKVQIKNIVDYGWEQKYYFGRLVAVHLSGNYLAYGIKAHDKYVGVIRIVNRKTGDRTLLKGMAGLVKDLAFAHILEQVVLACIDEMGNLFVYQIFEESGKMNCVSLLQVSQPNNEKHSDHHRVIWCQYIPEEPTDDSDSSTSDDASKFLVMTHDDKAEMLNIELVTKHHGAGPILSSELHYGYQVITDHRQPIVDAAFSPDGAALATASLDGEVKFFQVYMHDESPSPRCLHQWKPHDGHPLSCLFFLDNHKNPNPEIQFWKFAITGADSNREMKVWSCESWNCLQTIRFETPPGEIVEPCIKAGLDLSATYLLLSDINRKVLYILVINQETELTVASMCSIAEFPLSFPMLSYAIVDASRKKYKQLADSEQVDDLDGLNTDEELEDEKNVVDGVVVRLYHIQPKSLQECRIAFQPKSSVPLTSSSAASISQDSIAFRDHLTDVSFDTSLCTEGDITSDEVIVARGNVVASTPVVQQILLTPDAFTSPNHNTTPALSATFSMGTPTSIPLPPVTPSEEASLTMTEHTAPLATSESAEPEMRHSGRSSGSSPSLEVQQILAVRKVSNDEGIKNDDEDDDELKDENKSLMKPMSPEVMNQPSAPHLPVDEMIPLEVAATILATATNPRLEYDTSLWPPTHNLSPQMKLASSELESAPVRQSGSSVDGGGDRSSALLSAELLNVEKRLECSLDDLHGTMHNVNQSLQSHRSEIASLRDDVKKYDSLANILQNIVHHMEKLEGSIATLQSKQLEQKRLEDILHGFEERERQRQERLLPALSQSTTNVLSNKLEHVVKHEMRVAVLPTLVKVMDSFKEQLQVEVAQKLTATDSLMKDNINKLLKSKGTIDAIAGATANALQTIIPAAYKDAFQNIVVPAFEKACHNMFQQLNDCFQRGTKEYVQQLETHLDRRRRQTEQVRDPLLSQLHTSLDTFQASSEQLSSTLSATVQEELQRQLHSSTMKMQDVLLQNIRVFVKDEIGSAMKEQQNVIGDSVLNAIRSRAVTPIATVDPQLQQAHIAQLVKQGQLNSAFQQALSASDLTLVAYVCETVPPEVVFDKSPCPLQQPVLLSLIQQLSASLNTQTEVKLKYLQDAVINLDCSNPITKEHVVTVVGSLRHKLQQFLQQNPNSEYVRVIRMLLLASQSVSSSSD